MLDSTALAAAVAHNAKFLGLDALADRTEDRIAIAIAFWQQEHGLEPDGAYDRATEESLNTAQFGVDGDDDHDLVPTGEPFRAPGTAFAPMPWPFKKGISSDSALGIPGPSGSAWARANIIDVHGLDTRPGGVTQLHRHVAPHVIESIRRGKLAAPTYVIKRCGGFVYRRIRHSLDGPLSKHARGGAFDINANENFSKTFGIDEDGPEPWSKEWLEIWPDGMPRAFVEAVESTGVVWGGRWRCVKGKRGYRDPMHFQVPRYF